jgi:hypothetical protein
LVINHYYNQLIIIITNQWVGNQQFFGSQQAISVFFDHDRGRRSPVEIIGFFIGKNHPLLWHG